MGVAKVNDKEAYIDAVKVGFSYDDSLLVEEFIDGRELECAVLGNKNPEVSPPGEITLTGDYEIYSFDAKYVDEGAANIHIPANVTEENKVTITDVCSRVFTLLECNDLARVDLFLKETGEIFVNELNTLPGFTNISMFPKLCGLLGYSYGELLTKLIELALARKEAQNKLIRQYESGLS